ncbi:MAG: GNAT family N-acetyltransferase [Clostridiaceae bacterium]|nr:GNAT family N-acetyltransferase [Clostridiaceae bacterium]
MIEILRTGSVKWNEYLNKISLEQQDIYYTDKYHKLYEENGDGTAYLFVFSDGEKLALYPFMMNEIEGYELSEKYYDIETVYGYGGPILNCNDELFVIRFEEEFLKFCNKNNIVTEFLRFHPLMKNESIFNKQIKILHNRVTVWLNLSKSEEEIWKEDITSKNRNMIRKAIKNGLTVEASTDFYAFKEIYKGTMGKVNAENYYYFNDKYYDLMKENSNYLLLNVKKDNKVIAGAIFMIYKEYFHYHLSASLEEYLKYSPNNLLLWEAIKYGKSMGCKKMHFGGGLTDTTEDNLFKFKSSFSKKHSDYYIGKRVHNEKIYNYLINEWENRNNKQAKLLLQYRY